MLSCSLYEQAKEFDIDVLLDDRKERPGVMFADADLIGSPHQVIVGKSFLEKNMIEYKCRKSGEKIKITYDLKSILERIRCE